MALGHVGSARHRQPQPPAVRGRRSLQGAYDPYAFVRNAYLQHRDFKVSGGQPPQDENQQEQQLLEEADQAEKDNAAATAPVAPPGPPPGTPPPK